MTFSCAEYYWPEIKTLLKQRYEVADLPVPDFVEENFMQHINDMTLVVQEYFQLRVQSWLNNRETYLQHQSSLAKI